MNPHLKNMVDEVLDISSKKNVIGMYEKEITCPDTKRKITSYTHYAGFYLGKEIHEKYQLRSLEDKVKWYSDLLLETFELIRASHPIRNSRSTDEYLRKMLENAGKGLTDIFTGRSKWSEQIDNILLEPCLVLVPENHRLGGLRIVVFVKDKMSKQYISVGSWNGD